MTPKGNPGRSTLFKLKEWVRIAEAAQYLTLVENGGVTLKRFSKSSSTQ